MKEHVEVGPSELICTTFVNENKSTSRDTNERNTIEVSNNIKRTTRRTYAEAVGK